jgi:hypothetical protein
MTIDTVVAGVQPTTAEPHQKRRVLRIELRVPVRVPCEQVRVALEVLREVLLAEPGRMARSNALACPMNAAGGATNCWSEWMIPSEASVSVGPSRNDGGVKLSEWARMKGVSRQSATRWFCACQHRHLQWGGKATLAVGAVVRTRRERRGSWVRPGAPRRTAKTAALLRGPAA